MITGELKSQVDNVWNAFWTGGIANPLEVIEQITYLLFIKRLDDLHTAEEKKANILKKEIAKPIFNAGQQNLRWSRFKNEEPKQMYETVSQEVFPFIRQFRGDDTTYSDFMKDARLSIPLPALLSKVVDLIVELPLPSRVTRGDVSKYMLGMVQTP